MTESLLKLDDEVERVKVSQLHLRPGDILHITLGLDLGDGLPPWIPSSDEIHFTRLYWQSLVPVGVQVAVTHMGETSEVIRDDQRVAPIEHVSDANS